GGLPLDKRPWRTCSFASFSRKGQVAAVRPRSGTYVYVWRSSERGVLQVRGIGLRFERLLEAAIVALLVQEAVVLEDRLRVRPPALGLEVLDVALPVRRERSPEGAGRDVDGEPRLLARPPQDLEDPSPVERLLRPHLEEERVRLVRRDVPADDVGGLPTKVRRDAVPGLGLFLAADPRVLSVDVQEPERDRGDVRGTKPR